METNALPGTDIIIFNVPAGTYTLSIEGRDEDASATGDLDITDDLEIIGGADGTIIDAGDIDRVFDIMTGVTVEISEVTIKNGLIYNFPMGNYNGSGINNGGTLTLNNSTVSENYCDYGAGGEGGGIFNSSDSTLTLNNCTVSENTGFEAGGIQNYGTATLNNCTVSENTSIGGFSPGGIYNWGTVELKNTIVANNPGGPECSGTITSLGHNMASDGSCNLIQTTDVPDTDPLLGPLKDNGGPTETHALQPGSLAIDAIPVEVCVDAYGDPITTDQRGLSRPQGPACDIGSYELGISISIDEVIDFFKNGVADGSIEGRGKKRWLANVRLWIFGQMLESAKWRIENDKMKKACKMLSRIDRRCDGELRPKDFIIGEAVPELSEMILDTMESLECKIN